MPFTLIQGTFHLVNKTQNGNETGFEPDGDSIHFKPFDSSLLDVLTQLDQPYRLTNIGSVMLRFEGIDALELHYRPSSGGANTHQPRPLGDAARDFLTGELNLNPVPYAPPRNIRVKPPVQRDATPGYILSRSLEVHGRPVSFAFAGAAPEADGSEVFLNVQRFKKSLNYKLVANGFAYPLFYDTFFIDLRNSLTAAVQAARQGTMGIWSKDRTTSGVKANTQAKLEEDGVVFPKLFRRLTDYLAETGGGLAGFKAWLAAKGERVQDINPNSSTFTNNTGFDNLVKVQGNKVKLTQKPEHIVFISEK
jgi:endonuclease YncB( thermonuclease family)